MIPSISLWFVTDTSSVTRGSSVLQEVLTHWDKAPKIQQVDVQQVLDGNIDIQRGMIWYWLDPETTSEHDLYELLGLAEDHHVSVLLTHDSQGQTLGQSLREGVVACPDDADPKDIAAVAQSMASQCKLIESLKLEARALRTQSQGVGDQLGKMDEELRLAAQLQKEFLPEQLPEVDGVAFHALWRPAGYVGGDLYDAVRLDEDHIAFFLADAVGHGVSAALMTMFIKRSLDTKSISNDLDGGYQLIEPSQAMAKLNRDMYASQTGKVRFATACYGIINCKTLELRFARAGHPYPMLLRGDGTMLPVEPEGGLLGVFPEEVFEQATVQMLPGDRMLIFSDGFETAFPEAGQGDASNAANLQSERYIEEFKKFGQGDPAEAFANLRHCIDHEAGSLNQKDDLTLLCLAIDEKAQVQAASIEAAA